MPMNTVTQDTFPGLSSVPAFSFSFGPVYCWLLLFCPVRSAAKTDSGPRIRSIFNAEFSGEASAGGGASVLWHTRGPDASISLPLRLDRPNSRGYLSRRLLLADGSLASWAQPGDPLPGAEFSRRKHPAPKEQSAEETRFPSKLRFLNDGERLPDAFLHSAEAPPRLRKWSAQIDPGLLPPPTPPHPLFDLYLFACSGNRRAGAGAGTVFCRGSLQFRARCSVLLNLSHKGDRRQT